MKNRNRIKNQRVKSKVMKRSLTIKMTGYLKNSIGLDIDEINVNSVRHYFSTHGCNFFTEKLAEVEVLVF